MTGGFIDLDLLIYQIERCAEGSLLRFLVNGKKEVFIRKLDKDRIMLITKLVKEKSSYDYSDSKVRHSKGSTN